MEKKLTIIQMILNAVVLIMCLINLSTSPHNYFSSYVILSLLGLSMGVQGVTNLIKKEKKWLISLSFLTAAFCLYSSFINFFR